MSISSVQTSYKEVTEFLYPHLSNFQPKVVGIDGRDGAGKTTLGRYLSWYFNSSLIETDLFLSGNSPEITYELDCLLRVIRNRFEPPPPLPLFIEGIKLLELVEQLPLPIDFNIYVTNSKFGGNQELANMLDVYDQKYKPKERAHLSISVNV